MKTTVGWLKLDVKFAYEHQALAAIAAAAEVHIERIVQDAVALCVHRGKSKIEVADVRDALYRFSQHMPSMS